MRHYPYFLFFYCFAEHVCTVATTCSACTSDAWYGRAARNGWRLCSTAPNGWDGNAPHAALWNAPNGKLLIRFSSLVSLLYNVVGLVLPFSPPLSSSFPVSEGGIRDRYLDFVGIYVARVFVDNLFHKKVFFWWGGGGTCIHLAVVAGGPKFGSSLFSSCVLCTCY